ncbi:MAG: hypothetical protein Q7S63_01285 [bacterium]|nr:hypothetical protein [bacterium]
MTRTIGTIRNIYPDLAVISVVADGVSDEATATPKEEGFDLLAGIGVGGRVSVEVYLIPPRTSARTHLGITKIFGKVSSQERPSPEAA